MALILGRNSSHHRTAAAAQSTHALLSHCGGGGKRSTPGAHVHANPCSGGAAAATHTLHAWARSLLVPLRTAGGHAGAPPLLPAVLQDLRQRGGLLRLRPARLRHQAEHDPGRCARAPSAPHTPAYIWRFRHSGDALPAPYAGPEPGHSSHCACAALRNARTPA